MSKEICCFAGHSLIEDVTKVREMVREKVLLTKKEGVREFWVSRYAY